MPSFIKIPDISNIEWCPIFMSTFFELRLICYDALKWFFKKKSGLPWYPWISQQVSKWWIRCLSSNFLSSDPFLLQIWETTITKWKCVTVVSAKRVIPYPLRQQVIGLKPNVVPPPPEPFWQKFNQHSSRYRKSSFTVTVRDFCKKQNKSVSAGQWGRRT